jgi:hypothetical protein
VRQFADPSFLPRFPQESLLHNPSWNQDFAKAMRKRQVWVEPLFAEGKDWHGLRRLRSRGLLNANIQGLLIVAGQNLKRFLVASGWARRHAPLWEPGHPLRGALQPLSRLRVTADLTGERSIVNCILSVSHRRRWGPEVFFNSCS